MDAIEQEVRKLIDSGFICEEQHPDLVANIVPIPKKNGSIHICIDFRNLNNACPKDEFPLPVTDIMVENTANYERMSFMDGFSGYNQIKMHPDDEKHTAFRTPLGVFFYTVMPFGLKNPAPLISGQWIKFSPNSPVRLSNPTLTTLSSRIATKVIIFEILGRCS